MLFSVFNIVKIIALTLGLTQIGLMRKDQNNKVDLSQDEADQWVCDYEMCKGCKSL